MKTYIQEKVTYYVNSEKKVVTCTTKASIDVSKIFKKLSFLYIPAFTIHSKHIYINGNTISITVTRKATCSPEDIFDVEKGKHIAQTKCQAAIYYKFSRIIHSISQKLIQASINLKVHSNNLLFSEEIANRHLEELDN
jgi:hypothetical protein